MRMWRLCRTNSTDILLLTVFITLCYVFIQRRGYMNKVDIALGLSEQSSHMQRELQQHNELPSAPDIYKNMQREGTIRNPLKIDDRIKRIGDVRQAQCKTNRYNSNNKVCIIIDFFDYSFYDLKMTIDSVRLHTSEDLIHEIIMVDDGSTLDYIKEDSRIYSEKLNYARLIRLEQREGSGKARVRGAQEASCSYLVFLDTNTVVTVGWLEPLIDVLEKHETIVAVPHYDSINDPVSYEYSRTASNLITVFTWSLTMRMYHIPDKVENTENIETPVTRGNAFAIRKQLFIELGAYDEDMRDTAAENLEFSFRAWMCGAKLQIIPCSRVGVLNLNQPLKINRHYNIRRITELWLSSRKEYVYKSTNTNIKDKNLIEDQYTQNLKVSMEQKQCKNLEWYLKHVAKHIYTPSMDAMYYGLLKCKSGRCATVANDSRINLGSCKAKSYQLHKVDMLIELTEEKLLRTKGKCLATKESAYVIEKTCDKTDSKFHWEYDSVKGQLTNVWSGYCAMHVTDPDKRVSKGRQIMMVQECSTNTDAKFMTWDFISP